MSPAVERYIDSLPIDTGPRHLLNKMVQRPDNGFMLGELMRYTGFSIMHVERCLRELRECGAVKKRKDKFYLYDPRLLQHLEILTTEQKNRRYYEQ